MVILPIATSPPNLDNCILKHKEIKLSVDCITKGAIPKAKLGNNRLGTILKFSFFNLRTVCLPLKKRMTQIALIACEMMVASAAPLTPILNPKIKIGSKIMFKIAPIKTVIILVLENP